MLRSFLVGMIRLYQVGISSWTPPSCRFTPSCSAYAIEALERHGAGRGVSLTARRLMRCHPWGGQGYDPVPISGTIGSGRKEPEQSEGQDAMRAKEI